MTWLTYHEKLKTKSKNTDLRPYIWIRNNEWNFPKVNYLRMHLFFRGFWQLPQIPQASLLQNWQPSSLHTLPRLLCCPGLAGTGPVDGKNISMALCSCCCSEFRVGCWPCSATMAAIKFCNCDGRTGCCGISKLWGGGCSCGVCLILAGIGCCWILELAMVGWCWVVRKLLMGCCCCSGVRTILKVGCCCGIPDLLLGSGCCWKISSLLLGGGLCCRISNLFTCGNRCCRTPDELLDGCCCWRVSDMLLGGGCCCRIPDLLLGGGSCFRWLFVDIFFKIIIEEELVALIICCSSLVIPPPCDTA